MPTPYGAIYERALFRLSDTKLAQLQPEEQEYILNKHLMAAVADFEPKCAENLADRDDKTKSFTGELSNEVQEILALGMSYYWLSAQVLNSELLKNKLSTKDYTYFSPANLLRESGELRNSVQKEYRRRITDYTFDHGDLAMEGSGS